MLTRLESGLPGIVVGDGMIGEACRQFHAEEFSAVFFASGVADSSCTDPGQFLRERALLEYHLEEYGNLPLIYFSSASVYDHSLNQTSAYVAHKLLMERLVSTRPPYVICRITQIVGKSRNKRTIVSSFYQSIVNRQLIKIQRSARRNFIDVDDMVRLVLEALRAGEGLNQVIDVGSLRYDSPMRLLEVLGARVGLEPVFEMVDGGGSFEVDPSIAARFSGALGIQFDEDYLPAVIAKYVQPCAGNLHSPPQVIA